MGRISLVLVAENLNLIQVLQLVQIRDRDALQMLSDFMSNNFHCDHYHVITTIACVWIHMYKKLRNALLFWLDYFYIVHTSPMSVR
jgi:hypothetical protein